MPHGSLMPGPGHAHLLEAHDVGMVEHAVVEDLPLHVLVDLIFVGRGEQGRLNCKVPVITFSPRSMNFTAMRSPVALSMRSLAMPAATEDDMTRDGMTG